MGLVVSKVPFVQWILNSMKGANDFYIYGWDVVIIWTTRLQCSNYEK